MGKVRLGRSERGNVRVVNQTWVDLHCACITERDKYILKVVDTWRILRSDQVTQLVEGFSNINKGQQRCNDRLRQLFNLHVINKESPSMPPGKGTSRQYVWLDRAGYLLLGKVGRPNKTLPADYLHAVGIVDVFLALKGLPGIEIIEHWNERQALTTKLKPDLVVVLKHGRRGFIYIIEVDRGLTTAKREADKLKAYIDWKFSERWRNEPWSKYMPHPKFPPIIYIIDQQRGSYKARAEAITKLAKGLDIHSTTFREFQHYILQLLT